MNRGLSVALTFLVTACASASIPGADGGPAPVVDSAPAPDGRAPPDTIARLELGLVPDQLPAEIGVDTTPPPPPLIAARGLIHMHSIYSHDACDGQGFIDGKPNAECLAQLRAAACANKLDFLSLTDHPAHMRDYPMQDTLLYDAAAGDQLVMHQGLPIANRLACPGGHRVLVTVGFEATHMMPVGLHQKPQADDPLLYSGVTDATDPATLASQIQGLKDLGAVVSVVHSEEADISAKTIEDAGYEMMEWYNIHASFTALLGDDLLSADLENIVQLAGLVSTLQDIADFLTPSKKAHPDLVYLLLLDGLPPEGFDKWRSVQRGRPITGILGSDIHRNVSVDASMCAGGKQLACIAALAVVESTLGITLSPVIKTLLLSGGSIAMPDGDRIDSYARLMRWLENRVLVKTVEPLEIAEALRAGRCYGVFTVFGDPQGLLYRAAQGNELLQIGDVASGPITLQLALPPHPVPVGAPFTAAEALTAEVRAQLIHTDASGSKVIHEVTTLGSQSTKLVDQPGAYHLELWIRPSHLEQALGSASTLAAKEYLWVITNPIRIGGPV